VNNGVNVTGSPFSFSFRMKKPLTFGYIVFLAQSVAASSAGAPRNSLQSRPGRDHVIQIGYNG
jgi:hypothetical protein